MYAGFARSKNRSAFQRQESITNGFLNEISQTARRSTTLRKQLGRMRLHLSIEVIQYLLDHLGIFSAIVPDMALPPTSVWSDAGDHFELTTTLSASLDVNKVN